MRVVSTTDGPAASHLGEGRSSARGRPSSGGTLVPSKSPTKRSMPHQSQGLESRGTGTYEAAHKERLYEEERAAGQNNTVATMGEGQDDTLALWDVSGMPNVSTTPYLQVATLQ